MNPKVPITCHIEPGIYLFSYLPGKAEMGSKSRVSIVYTSKSLRL